MNGSRNHEATANSTDTDTTETPRTPLYFPFREEVFDTSTEKQRLILLVARNNVLNQLHRGTESTQRRIAGLADVSNSYVTNALCKYVSRTELPVAYAVSHMCVGDKTWEDLTEFQTSIIEEVVADPDAPNREIADRVGCSANHVYNVKRIYNDLIQTRNPHGSLIDTPVESTDIPLSDMLADSTSEADPTTNPTVPRNVSATVAEPFTPKLIDRLTVNDRFALLAAREWALRETPNTRGVADTTGRKEQRVEEVIGQFVGQGDSYPVAAAVGRQFFPDMSYDSLRGNKLQVVNHRIANPDTSMRQIARDCNVPYHNAKHTINKYRGIIKQRRAEVS